MWTNCKSSHHFLTMPAFSTMIDVSNKILASTPELKATEVCMISVPKSHPTESMKVTNCHSRIHCPRVRQHFIWWPTSCAVSIDRRDSVPDTNWHREWKPLPKLRIAKMPQSPMHKLKSSSDWVHFRRDWAAFSCESRSGCVRYILQIVRKLNGCCGCCLLLWFGCLTLS